MSTLNTAHPVLHYWVKGKAADLAKGVKAALDAQGATAR